MTKKLIVLFSLLLLWAELPAESARYDITEELERERQSDYFQAKVLYLSFWGAGSKRVTDRIVNLYEKTEINAVIIDIKNEYGQIAYRGTVPKAKSIGAYNHSTVKDMGALVRNLKAQGLYVIGRIVVFKDHLFATRHPNLAIQNDQGEVWINNEKLAWSNPASTIVREYNVAIAKEAAAYGFDEINFDYIRFPASRTIRFGKPNNETQRVRAISSFLKEAKEVLAPTGAKISVDTYGYVCWNENDTQIGHKLEELEKYADYICPMLYPSGFHLGIPGYPNPMTHPYEIIFYSLEKAHERTGIDRRRFRPWLQAFRDYSFDKRAFKGEAIREQITAAEDFGAGGWLLWHSASYFVADGLLPAAEPFRVVGNTKTAPVIENSGVEDPVLQLQPKKNF